MHSRTVIAPIRFSPVVCLSLVAAPVASVVAQSSSGLAAPPGARVVSLPRRAGDVAGETSVAVDPTDPRRVLVAYQQIVQPDPKLGKRGKRGLDVRVARSEDGGSTWTVAQETSAPNYLVSGDPSVVIDLHGHAFLGYLGFDHVGLTWYWGKGASRNGIFVRRSLDGGKTWEPNHTPLIEYPTGPNPPFQDKGYLVVDNRPESPHAGNIYFGWTRYTLEKSEILLSRSTDDGATWSAPIVISSDSGLPRGSAAGAVVGFQGTVGKDGTLYTIWPDGQAIVLAVSRDGGRTFSRSRRVVATTPPLFPAITQFPGSNALPTVSIDPRTVPGRLVLSWGDYRYGDLDILSATSDDGGETWSAPVRVNDDSVHNGKDQILSWMTVDPTDGSVYALFYDRRADTANVLPSLTLARSTDGARSFQNFAWTAAKPDPKRAHFGDYIGLAARDGWVYGAWVEDEPRRKGAQRPVPRTSIGQPIAGAIIRVGIARFGDVASSGDQRQ
jgi:hypothetical protein